MSMPVHPEPDGCFMPLERCCICRDKTPFWTELPDRKPGEQVALCPACAKLAEPQDIPTKELWCRRERIAHQERVSR